MTTQRQHRKGPPARKGSHSLLKGPKAAAGTTARSGKLTSTKNKIRGVERLLRKVSLVELLQPSKLMEPVARDDTGWR